MIALKVNKIGNFMSKLLASECFDSFLLQEAVIRMAVTWSLDGHMNRSFFDRETWEDSQQRPYELTPWKDVRGICFDLIKGKRTPAGFRFILTLKNDLIPGVLSREAPELSNICTGLVLNITFEEGLLWIVTGVSMNTFTLDKSADVIWDRTVQKFLTAKEIDYSLMD